MKKICFAIFIFFPFLTIANPLDRLKTCKELEAKKRINFILVLKAEEQFKTATEEYKKQAKQKIDQAIKNFNLVAQQYQLFCNHKK